MPQEHVNSVTFTVLSIKITWMVSRTQMNISLVVMEILCNSRVHAEPSFSLPLRCDQERYVQRSTSQFN